MGQEEFLISFKQALSGQIDDYKIQDHINYYRNYIRQQMASGKAEQEVLNELGNPRLLAKTIIEREKFASNSGEETYREFNSRRSESDSYSQNEDRTDAYNAGRNGRVMHLPLWLVAIIAIIVVALLICAAFALISFFAPVIIVALIAAGVYGIIRRVAG